MSKIGKFFAKSGANTATKKGLENTQIPKPMRRIIGLGVGGAVGGAIEGFAVAVPILTMTKDKAYSFAIGILSGIAEFLAAFIPLAIVSFISLALPVILALAAGAMIYVVVHEVVPEIYGHGHDEASTIGFFTGFIVMLLLDSLLT